MKLSNGYLKKTRGAPPPRPRVTFVLPKVTKSALPRKTRPLRGYPHPSLASGGAHTAHSLRRMRTRSIPAAPRWARLRPCLGARLAYGAGKATELNHGCSWAPYGAPEHRKPAAERLKGCAMDRARRTPAQGCAVGRPHAAGAKRREWSRHPGRLSFGDFSLAKQRKVTRERGGSPIICVAGGDTAMGGDSQATPSIFDRVR